MKRAAFIMTATLWASLLAGCAGPTTPLGAPWATTGSDTRNGPLAFIAGLFRSTGSEITFAPKHQVLHGPSPLTVTIRDPNGVRSNYKLVVRHNGLDVTSSFLRQAKVTTGPKWVRIAVPRVRLPASADHRIEVIYGGASDLTAYARYEAPVCRAFIPQKIQRTNDFTPAPELLTQIERISKGLGFNPAFVAALIAQESGFDSRTVSWAKAIGLTQVTALAEYDVVDEYAHWPRYPGLNELPALFVKALVLSGHANPGNEWRLNSEMSIQGGLIFAQRLAERWSTPENMSRIRATFEDAEVAQTELLLASYNSGFARVNQAFGRLGANWLTASELKEARKYVHRISSYCEHFSEQSNIQGSTNEDET